MRLIPLFALILLAGASAAEDPAEPSEARALDLKWRTVPLAAKSAQESKRLALQDKGVVLRPAPPADPLVAIPRPDGSLEIRHRRAKAPSAGEAEPQR